MAAKLFLKYTVSIQIYICEVVCIPTNITLEYDQA